MTSDCLADNNYYVLGRLYQYLRGKTAVKERERDKLKDLLETNFEVNYKLPSNSFVCRRRPEYSGNTALHLLAEFGHDDYLLDWLLELGADLSVQNSRGHTPLMLAYVKGHKIEAMLRRITDFAPCGNGISAIHLACTTELVDVVDSLLKAGCPVDLRVNDDSPIYPGYTALHFAMQYCKPRVMKLLLSRGASLRVKNARGLSPLHLLVNNLVSQTYVKPRAFFVDAVKTNLFQLPDESGFTCLHLACMLDDEELLDSFVRSNVDLDASVAIESPVCPGYTALHFAAHFNLESVLKLLRSDADILAPDAYGISPLELCLQRINLDEVVQVILLGDRHDLSLVKFTDNTFLLDFLRSLDCPEDFEEFLEEISDDPSAYIPYDSLIWPGYNLLHLLVSQDLADYCEYLIDIPNVWQLNAEGSSPLHLAYRKKAFDAVNFLLSIEPDSLENTLDRADLSTLHIACAMEKYDVVEHLLSKEADPNIATSSKVIDGFYAIHKAGSTPLHLAVEARNCRLIKLLLSYGANPHLANSAGLTPFHDFLRYYCGQGQRGDHEVHAVLQEMLSVQRQNALTGAWSIDTLKIVVELDCNFVIWRWLSEIEHHCYLYGQLGLTSLHFACALGDIAAARKALESGIDVNQRVDDYSPIWPGDTALHVLYRKSTRFVHGMAELLLKYGADVTLKNAAQRTPLHLSGERRMLEAQLGLMRKTGRFTTENPVDGNGLSHFHLSCMTNDLVAVDEFLKSGVNIDDPVDYFADDYAGYTALHFAAIYSDKRIVRLLIDEGAILLKNAYGQTPLDLAQSKLEGLEL